MNKVHMVIPRKEMPLAFWFLIFGLVQLNARVLPSFPILPDAARGQQYQYGDGTIVTFSTDVTISGTLTWEWINLDDPGTPLENDLGIELNNLGQIQDDVLLGGVRSDAPLGVYHIRVRALDNGSPVDFRDYSLVVINGIFTCPPVHDFALVLDASGSMNRPAGTTTRWGQLREAVETYLPVLDAFLEEDDGTNDNNLQVIFFKGSSATVIGQYDDTFDGIDFSDIDNLREHVFGDGTGSPVTAGGNTPMGQGIIQANNNFSSSSRTIILLSDGRENMPPCYDESNNQIINDVGDVLLDFNTAPGQNIRVFTIGVGGSDEPELQALSNPDGDALFAHSYNSTEMDFMFNSTIPESLFGCSPRMVDYRFDTLAGFSSFINEEFLVDSLVRKLVVQLVTKTPNARLGTDPQLLKNGDLIPVTPTLSSSGNRLTYIVDLPLLQHSGAYLDGGGTWELRFSGTAGADYELTIMVDDKYLRTDAGIANNNTLYSGDPIAVNTTVTFAGQPLEDATVTAILAVPGEDIKDLLASTTVNEPLVPLETALPSGVNESFLRAQAKIDVLLNQPGFLAQIQPNNREINLIHQADGTYRGTFDGNSDFVSGTYRLFIRYRGTIPGFGAYESVDIKHVFLDFARPANINLRRTLLPLPKGGDGQRNLSIRINPTNQLGKKLGPGQAHRIGVFIGDEKLVLNDNLDGTYSSIFSIRSGERPPVKIFVIDESEPVSEFILPNFTKNFGASLHGGYLTSLNNTAPLATTDQGNYFELDLTYRLSDHFQLQLVGGNYQFNNNIALRGGTLFAGYDFTKPFTSRIYPRLSVGAGLFKPETSDLTFALGVRGSLFYQFSPGFEGGFDAGIFSLLKPGYLLGHLGAGIRIYF